MKQIKKFSILLLAALLILTLFGCASTATSSSAVSGVKLLTLNTHSIVEPDYEEKLEKFVDYIAENDFDVIALQEVNQTNAAPAADESRLAGFVSDGNTVIKEDNYIMRIAEMLRQRGVDYYWTWTPIKLGYDKYDEGVGILCKEKPLDVESFYISHSSDFSNWQARKVIGVTLNINGEKMKFYSTHFGWWSDPEEDFQYQYAQFLERTKDFDGRMFLMGDFNNPAEMDAQGYDMVLDSGWKDTYVMASEKDEGLTVVGEIDGWRDDPSITSMRIDFIMTNQECPVKSSYVVFNGDNGPVVSDHFGVEVEL